jgi:uncharacterized NAD-dependent epimerase/dehydratase family protein
MNTGTMSCEAALRQYFDAFDGSKKNFSEVDELFNAVYHEKYTLVMNGKTFDRDMAKDVAAGYLARGSKVDVVDLRRIDADRIGVQIGGQNEEEYKVGHVVYTIEDNKIVKAHVIDN